MILFFDFLNRSPDRCIFECRIQYKCPKRINCSKYGYKNQSLQIVGMPYSYAEIRYEEAQRNISYQPHLLSADIHRMVSVIRWLYVSWADSLLKFAEIVVVYSPGNLKIRYISRIQVISEQVGCTLVVA